MLIDVETLLLDTGIYTETMYFLDSEEQDHTANGSPKVDDQNAESLCTQEAPTMTIQQTAVGSKETGQQRTQDATYTVY